MKVLVIGASGMIGNTVFRVLTEKSGWDIFGSIRDEGVKRFFPASIHEKLIPGVDLECQELLATIFGELQPDVVVNCAGLTKHLPEADDPVAAISINSLMPHRLASLCKLAAARLIHISTDCVFTGEKGGYVEEDLADASDLYGKSKALGEVTATNTITLRTSTIGHELKSRRGLLEWFLSQEGYCKGYSRAIFSGLPTVVLAQIVRDVVIPNTELSGLYHVAANPIAKHDLLRLIADVYEKNIDIMPDDKPRIDRSLDASRFRLATGYVAPKWSELIKLMHAYKNISRTG
jgi:dTDP-4-dehydrorhamnose reductase